MKPGICLIFSNICKRIHKWIMLIAQNLCHFSFSVKICLAGPCLYALKMCTGINTLKNLEIDEKWPGTGPFSESGDPSHSQRKPMWTWSSEPPRPFLKGFFSKMWARRSFSPKNCHVTLVSGYILDCLVHLQFSLLPNIFKENTFEWFLFKNGFFTWFLNEFANFFELE